MLIQERELVLKCFKMGTRMVSVGDENQLIYQFSGSDKDSLNTLKNLPNTKCLPLSISYRCADSIVEYAQRIVPSIEKNDDHRAGNVLEDVPLEDVKDGDNLFVSAWVIGVVREATAPIVNAAIKSALKTIAYV